MLAQPQDVSHLASVRLPEAAVVRGLSHSECPRRRPGSAGAEGGQKTGGELGGEETGGSWQPGAVCWAAGPVTPIQRGCGRSLEKHRAALTLAGLGQECTWRLRPGPSPAPSYCRAPCAPPTPAHALGHRVAEAIGQGIPESWVLRSGQRGAGQALDGSAAPCPAGTGCSQSGARTRCEALLPGTKGVLVLGYPDQLASRRGPPSTPGALSSGVWGFRIYTDTPALCLSPGPDGGGGLVQMGWTWPRPSGLGGKSVGTACPLGKLKVTNPLPWGPPASPYPAPHRPRCTRAHTPTRRSSASGSTSPVDGPGRPSCPRLC